MSSPASNQPQQQPQRQPHLVAQTTTHVHHAEEHNARDNNTINAQASYFKSAQWSPDGTCIVASHSSNHLQTFVVPTDLLDETYTAPHILHNYSAISPPFSSFSPSPSSGIGSGTRPAIGNGNGPATGTGTGTPEPIYTFALYPHYTLHPSHHPTTLALSSRRDHPTQLHNLFSPTSKPLASYPLITPTTETHTTPHSLLFQPSAAHFLAGAESLVALFDLHRDGDKPVVRMQTIPSKRHKIKGGGVGIRGIVSTLALQPSSSGTSSNGHGDTHAHAYAAENAMLAAGTWTRWVGLYDASGLGGTVATWDVTSAADKEARIGGSGISQVAWSACGRYLIVAERMSRGMLVYDVRVTGKLVAWCEGRNAETNQRLGIDVFGSGQHWGAGATDAGTGTGRGTGSDVWAGGTDGCIGVWEDIGMREGACLPDRSWRAHGSAVTSVGLHPSGTVVMSSSGCRDPEPAMCRGGRGSAGEHDSVSSDDDDNAFDESDSLGDETSSVDSDLSNRRHGFQGSYKDSVKIWGLLDYAKHELPKAR